ncbi:SET domain-containing protein SmydA-8-like isoform X2 [Scylla paramamosain]|uniref:SET domain-containing protein SmydA-8-like isoform X2 n=1 Tax=Scylla paramamosain TaxID=85552 RepID=UPI0030828E6A
METRGAVMAGALLPSKHAAGLHALLPGLGDQIHPHLVDSCEAQTPPSEPAAKDSPLGTPGAAPPCPTADLGAAGGLCSMQRSARYGRYLVTQRAVAAGQVLLEETPLLVVPKVDSETSCLACMAPLRVEWTACRTCGGPLCATDCRGAHHGATECRLLQRMGFREAPHLEALIKELNVILGPLRLLLLVQESRAAREAFLSLESHAAVRLRLPVGKFVEEHIVGGLRQRLGLALPRETVHHACGVLDTNCFEVTLDNAGHGRAIFPAAAMMNHSCVPNAHWWFYRGRLVVCAATALPRGTPVLISYTHALWGTRVRAAQLTTCKMFTCTCERCRDPAERGSHLSSVRCRVCGDVVVPPSQRQDAWQCRACGNTVEAALVEALVHAGATQLAHLREETAAGVVAAVTHLSRLLGPHHYVVARARHCFLEVLFAAPLSEAPKDLLQEAVNLARHLTAVLQLLEPGVSRMTGLLLYYETAAATELLLREGTGDEEARQTLLNQATHVESLLQYDRFLPRAALLSAALREWCPAARTQ